MMEQLGIKALRPGPSGNEAAPNHANYDESTANPYPNLPDVLKLKNGKKVTSAKVWWEQRRPEIVEDFDREVLGRVPKNVPKVTWTVANTVNATVGSRAVIGKQLVGHVDSSAYPGIQVDIQMQVVTPPDATGPVPVVMMCGWRGLRQFAPPQAAGAGRRGPWGPGGFGPPPGSDPPATEQLIADGWGFATINPGSIQADNGAGLTKGIIGLVNKGEPRKPDDWGAAGMGGRAAVCHLETDKAVDAKHVGSKAFRDWQGGAGDDGIRQPVRRGAGGLSGEGARKLHRRNWGEAVET
jgi:hypothetical protein